MNRLPLYIVEEIQALNKAGLAFDSIVNHVRLKYPIELNSWRDTDLEEEVRLLMAAVKPAPSRSFSR